MLGLRFHFGNIRRTLIEALHTCSFCCRARGRAGRSRSVSRSGCVDALASLALGRCRRSACPRRDRRARDCRRRRLLPVHALAVAEAAAALAGPPQADHLLHLHRLCSGAACRRVLLLGGVLLFFSTSARISSQRVQRFSERARHRGHDVRARDRACRAGEMSRASAAVSRLSWRRSSPASRGGRARESVTAPRPGDVAQGGQRAGRAARGAAGSVDCMSPRHPASRAGFHARGFGGLFVYGEPPDLTVNLLNEHWCPRRSALWSAAWAFRSLAIRSYAVVVDSSSIELSRSNLRGSGHGPGARDACSIETLSVTAGACRRPTGAHARLQRRPADCRRIVRAYLGSRLEDRARRYAVRLDIRLSIGEIYQQDFIGASEEGDGSGQRRDPAAGDRRRPVPGHRSRGAGGGPRAGQVDHRLGARAVRGHRAGPARRLHPQDRRQQPTISSASWPSRSTR